MMYFTEFNTYRRNKKCERAINADSIQFVTIIEIDLYPKFLILK